jgi:hypothetical protein
MAEIKSRRAVVAAKIESVVGTAETLAAADANFLIMDPKFNADIPMFDRKNLDQSISPFAPIPGAQKATLTFKVENKGSGTAGTAPAIGKLMKACGMGETLVAVTSATYAPISTAFPSVTIALYKDGLKKQIRGARGTFKFSTKVGEPMMVEFTFEGVYDGVSDVAILTGTGIETTIPVPFLNVASFTAVGYASKISHIAIDLGNKLEMRSDIAKAEGFIACLITDRDPKGSMDPEEELVATDDRYLKWKAGTSGTIVLPVGATAGNICTITAPKAMYTKLAEGDRGGLAVLAADFRLVRSAAAGNDELVLAYT